MGRDQENEDGKEGVRKRIKIGEGAVAPANFEKVGAYSTASRQGVCLSEKSCMALRCGLAPAEIDRSFTGSAWTSPCTSSAHRRFVCVAYLVSHLLNPIFPAAAAALAAVHPSTD